MRTAPSNPALRPARRFTVTALAFLLAFGAQLPLATPFFAPIARASDPDLVGSWSFDAAGDPGANTGTAAAVYPHLTLSGGAVRDPGEHPPLAGNVASLAVTDGSVASTGNTTTVDLGGALSVFAWVKATDASTLTSWIVSKWGVGGEFRLGIQKTGAGGMRLAARLYSGGNQDLNHDLGMRWGEWILVGFTFDGSTLRLYHDGTEAATKAVTLADIPSLTAPLTLGPDGSGYLRGWLDEVRIYARTLAPSEILGLVDAAAPSLALASRTPASGNGRETDPFSATFTADDSTTGGRSVTSGELRLDGGAWTPGHPLDGAFDEPVEDFSTGVLALVPGDHEVCARATDDLGNVSELVCTTFRSIEAGPPSVRLVSVTPALTVAFGTPVAVVFAASDGTTGGSSITTGEIRLDGGAWATGIPTDGAFDGVEEEFSSGTLDALGVGTHGICGRAIDASGNTSLDTPCATIVVTDESAPSLRLDHLTPADGTTGVPYATVTAYFTGSDATTGGGTLTTGDYRVRLDGGAWTPDWTPLAAPDDGTWDEPTEEIVVPWTPTHPGTHEVCVRVTDASGNTSAPACALLTAIDDAGPALGIVATTPADATTGVPYQRLDVRFSASDGTTGASPIVLGQFRIRTNGGAWSPDWTTGFPLDGAFDGLVEDFTTGGILPTGAGSVEICARATDASANVSPIVCRTFAVIDDAPPVVTVTDAPSGPLVYGTQFAVVFAADDTTTGNSPIASGGILIDGAPPVAGSAVDGTFDEPVELVTSGAMPPTPAGPFLGVGSHLICGIATDASGNTSATSGDACVTVEVTAATSITLYTGQTYDEDGGPTSTLTASVTTPAICLVGGTLTFVVRDLAGTELTSGSVAAPGGSGSLTASLTDGIYLISVAWSSGDVNCLGSFDEAVLSVVRPGRYTATGGGWYKVTDKSAGTGWSGTPRVNFGFTVKASPAGRTTTYQGQLLWLNKGSFRLRATIATTSGDPAAYGLFSCPAGVTAAFCGSIRGGGWLESWSEGTGTWVRATGYGASGWVTFTASMYDGGSVIECKGSGRTKACTTKEKPDAFGIQFDPIATSVIRESKPVTLVQPTGNGSIRIY